MGRSIFAIALGLRLLPWTTALYENRSVIAPCDSPLYCQGEILREIELAQPFADSKTYVDLPTIRPIDEVIAAFDNLTKPLSNNTELNDFLTTYFGQAGSEIEPVPKDELQTDPSFLETVNDSNLRSFVSQVIDIWPDLTRRYVGASNCTGCVSSFIPLNRTFVVAGGRFREAYYWDSFWIVEGLLRTQGSFTQIALNIIENFLDLVDTIGFVPNGARVYYLNRSQPPLLTQMVRIYVLYTNDTSILERALPLLEKEYNFFMNNRTVTIGNHTLNHYAALNNQPRPESYREDYITANNESYYAESGNIYPQTSPLNDSEKALLYANLASGAESGWDYSSRWLKNPNDAARDVYFPLRSLNTIETVPVDLNSILYSNEITIAGFYNQLDDTNSSYTWAQRASARSAAMTDLMWDEDNFSYFDYNMTSGAKNLYVLIDEDAIISDTLGSGAPSGYQVAFSPSQFYPFWTGAAPDFLKKNPLAIRKAYTRVADQLSRKAGAISATNILTGQQWDEPNVWAPLQYILTAGLLNTPSTFGSQDPNYVWTQNLALNLSQRYVDSAFCTWRVTGGSTPNLAQLEGFSDPDSANGIMFEKYADNTTNAAGGGGEYEVVEGFGWSNGLLIWSADIFGRYLKTPDCGDISAANLDGGGGEVKRKRKRSRSAVELDRNDARWIKRWR